jgi:Resolvase, N terminal domain
MVVIREYAKKQGFTSVKEYSDQGKSGLNMEGRESLGQMLQDLKEGRAEYSVILVCDVSRWGRFQNPDESAVYEFACQQAGVSMSNAATLVTCRNISPAPSWSAAIPIRRTAIPSRPNYCACNLKNIWGTDGDTMLV